jgi:hypothetical protein
LLLLLRRRWALDLLDVRRLVLRRSLGVGVLRRWVVALRWALCGHRLVGRVGMVLMLVLVDYARPGMVHRKMIWRWQALRRVGVMLQAHLVSKAASANKR